MSHQDDRISLNRFYFFMCVFCGIAGILLGLSFKNPAVMSLSCIVLAGGSFFYGIQWFFCRRLEVAMSEDVKKREGSFWFKKAVSFTLCLMLFSMVWISLYYFLESSRIHEILLEFLDVK